MDERRGESRLPADQPRKKSSRAIVGGDIVLHERKMAKEPLSTRVKEWAFGIRRAQSGKIGGRRGHEGARASEKEHRTRKHHKAGN